MRSSTSIQPDSGSFWLPRLLLCGGLAGLVQLVVLWVTTWPLGVPEEWTWTRVDFEVLDLFGLWPALLTGGILAAGVVLGLRVLPGASPRVRCLCLLALWLFGTCWGLALTSSVPGIAGLSRAPFVLFYSRSSGYFTQARDEVKDMREFLAGYRDRISDSSNPENYLHMGTHPPGLTIGFVILIELCERSPALRDFLIATQPESYRTGMAVIEQNHAGRAAEVAQVDSAVLWLATLITALSGAGACVPLYLLARRSLSVEAAWWTAAFWLLVPAVAVFLPKSDMMFPAFTMWGQWLWLNAVQQRSVRFSIAAAALMFVAVCLSLAFAPVCLMFALQGLFVPISSREKAGETGGVSWFDLARVRVYLAGTATVFVLFLMVGLLGRINLISVFIQNLVNHASFYHHATRTYVSWLIANPVELGFALGLPLGMLAVAGVVLLARTIRPLRFEILIPALVWGLLWLSGKNMGEAARLWIFLMPYAVWMAGFAMDRVLAAESGRRSLFLLFVVQMIICIATVVRLDGFHFAELLSSTL